ncbi:uncharacterized protein LOC135844849 [Planococcus citri]|uniref:uncharacterized protein LOC135844849 n=1 Tax=Planococcus citri TaxID=170843 RepID=UPI0031F78C02
MHQPIIDKEPNVSKPYFVQLYQYCFDNRTKEIIYAEYTIENPQLFDSDLLQEEQTHEFKPVGLDYSNVATFYRKNDYNVPRMVGMPEFMPFALMRKPLYRYDAAAPLNEELDEMWSEFVKNLKKKISKKTHRIRVYSGVYDRKRVHGSSQYLDKKSTLHPSPFAFWLLLHNEDHSEGISFIMHNYAFDYFEERHQKLCERSICTEAGLEDSIPNPREYNYTMFYCCRSSAITKLYPFKKVKDDEILKFEEK